MIPIDVLLPYLAAVVLLALAPGPDNLFVITQAALNGARAGIMVVIGLCLGVLVHSAAVAFGLAALIQASAVAFTVIKLLGVAYLLYLAWGAWNAPPSELGGADRMADGALLRRGIIMNVTNPKVAIFFLAFFPQFTDPARGSMFLQVFTLGALFALVAFVIFGSLAFVSGGLRDRMNASPRIQVVMNRVAAVVFVGLAAKIGLSAR